MNSLEKMNGTVYQKGIEWKTDNNDGSVYISNCSFADRVKENLATRKWQILAGVAIIGVCAAVLAIAIPLFSATIVPDVAVLGTIFAIDILIVAIPFVLARIFSLPTSLAKVRAPAMLVEILGRKAVVPDRILRRKSTGQGFTGYAFNLKYRVTLGREFPASETLKMRSEIDLGYESSRKEQSQIGTEKQLADFGRYIRISERAFTRHLTPDRIHQILDETKLNFEFVRSRIKRLIAGETIGILNPKGEEQPVTPDSKIQPGWILKQ